MDGVGSLQASIAAVASEPKELPSRYSGAAAPVTAKTAAAAASTSSSGSRSRQGSALGTAEVTGDSSVLRPLPLNKSTVRPHF